MRNVLSNVPKSAQAMVAATVRTIFAQGDHRSASQQLHQVADSLQGRFPRVAEVLREAEEDVLAHMHFPSEHWPQLASTNPLERLNKEIKRRAEVVGIFPNRAAVVRLVGSVLMEQNDEWATGRRYFSQESMARLWPTEPTVPVDAVVAR